jgi:serine/threonine protein kinase
MTNGGDILLARHSQGLIYGLKNEQRFSNRYFSPEEITSNIGNPFRSDVWALGVILMECLSLISISDYDL